MNPQTSAVRLLAGDKEPVRLASTGNLALAGLLTVDGVVTVAGDRVLVKDQTNATENGIYTASAGTWYRAPDANSSRTLISGMKAHVQEGTVNGGAIWSLATNRPDVGDDDIEWEFYFSVGLIEEMNQTATDIIATIYALTGAADYASRAVAAAATLPSGMTFVRTAGYATAGDGGGALYKKVVSQPSHTGKFQSADGAWWELVYLGQPVTLQQFGAIGDGTTDDRAAMQSAIDMVAAGKGRIWGVAGKTYRAVINVGVTDLGLIMKNGATLDLAGSTINLECTGSVYGIRLQSNSHVVGPGTVKTTVSASPGAAGCYHAPISAAVNYGEVTNVAALGNYINAANWSVRNLTLDSVRNDGNGFCFSAVGGQNHGLIEDIVIPDNSAIFCGIGCDWGTVGAIASNNFTTSRTAWNAGLAYTVHPHDIVIQRIKMGALTGAGSLGVRLSGCYDIKVESVEVDSAVGGGFAHHGGDCGFEFAKPSPNVARWAYRGTVIRNFSIYDTTVGVGFLFDCLADNLKTAIAGGYVALTPAIGTTDAVMENCRSWSTSGATAGRGFWLRNCIGGVMRNCLAHRGSFGVNIEDGVDEFTIEGGEFALSYYDGITAGNADAPQNLAVLGARLWGNGQSGSGRAGIYFSTCINPRAERCIIGTRGGDATQSYGINVDSTCVNSELVGNRILGVKAAGVGMVLAGATDVGCFRLISDNTFDASVSSKITGLTITPIEIKHSVYGQYRRFLTSRASAFSTTPGFGTWVVGDTIEFVDPIATGYKGTTCTTAGTPGTWRNYGQLT
jgi:hypothetical protein